MFLVMARSSSLTKVYARCLDIVERTTCISSQAHHGLTSRELRCLESIADALLTLHCNIETRRRDFCRTSVDASSDDLPF